MSMAKEFLFWSQLRTAREKSGLTQSQLGDKAGVPATSIAHFEAGSRLPSYESLINICVALGESADSLMFGFERRDRYEEGARAFGQVLALVEKLNASMVASKEAGSLVKIGAAPKAQEES